MTCHERIYKKSWGVKSQMFYLYYIEPKLPLRGWNANTRNSWLASFLKHHKVTSSIG